LHYKPKKIIGEKMQDKNFFKEFADLLKPEDAPWYKILGKIFWKGFSTVGALAGAVPNVIFSSSYAQELFGDDEEWTILWAQISSGVVNTAIYFNSLDQIPDIISQIPDVFKKLDSSIQEKYGRNISRSKIMGAVLILFLVNIGSFFSNLEFAKESAAKFTTPFLYGFILYSQLIAATALVLRSTVNLALPYAKPEQQAAATIIRSALLDKLNGCLDAKLDPSKLEALKTGQLVMGVSSGLAWGLAAIPLAITLLYSGTFGIAAFQVLGTTSWWGTGMSIFGAIGSSVSKFTLLGKSIHTLSGNLSKNIEACLGGAEIFPEFSVGTLPIDVLLGVGLLAGGVWNTFFGAAWVVQSHLISLMTNSLVLQEVGGGVIGGVAALPINYNDTYNLLNRFLIWRGWRGDKKNLDDHELYIKSLMKMYAEMPYSEIINHFLDKKYVIEEALESGILHAKNPTQKEVMEQMGGVLNGRFFDLTNLLEELSKVGMLEKIQMYAQFTGLLTASLEGVMVVNGGDDEAEGEKKEVKSSLDEIVIGDEASPIDRRKPYPSGIRPSFYKQHSHSLSSSSSTAETNSSAPLSRVASPLRVSSSHFRSSSESLALPRGRSSHHGIPHSGSTPLFLEAQDRQLSDEEESSLLATAKTAGDGATASRAPSFTYKKQ
jgi:hypothetical protein